MSFLELFPEEHLHLFQSIASPLRLPRGEYLIRRGEPGGDIYLLVKGTLEVIDTRSTPEVIIAVLDEGTVVGELAFIDDAPRSADVRAVTDIDVLCWARDDLRALLARNAEFAARFYENIARLSSARTRTVTSSAVSGAITSKSGRNTIGLSRVREEAAQIAEVAKEALLSTETCLRQDPTDRLARQEVRVLLDRLQEDVRNLFLAHPETEAADEGARLLCRELHPYLVRSALADRCIRRPQGVTGTAEILAHLLVDTAGGEGQVGELIDRWLLDRPVFQAIRSFRESIIELLRRQLPRHRNRHVLLLNAGTGSLVAGVNIALSQPPTVLTVVDQSREALAFLDAGVTSRPEAVELRTVQENLVNFAMGRYRHRFPPQDAVVVHGLLEYMPDRIAVSLLKTCRKILTQGGAVVVATLGPSDDEELVDRLLSWPTIRRTREGTRLLFEAAQLVIWQEPKLREPAMLFGSTAHPEAKDTPYAPPRVANEGHLE